MPSSDENSTLKLLLLMLLKSSDTDAYTGKNCCTGHLGYRHQQSFVYVAVVVAFLNAASTVTSQLHVVATAQTEEHQRCMDVGEKRPMKAAWKANRSRVVLRCYLQRRLRATDWDFIVHILRPAPNDLSLFNVNKRSFRNCWYSWLQQFEA